MHGLNVPEGERLMDLQEEIAARTPGGKEALFAGDGRLREYVILMQGPGTGRAGSRPLRAREAEARAEGSNGVQLSR